MDVKSVQISNMGDGHPQGFVCPNGTLEIRNDTVLQVDDARSYFVLTGGPVFYSLGNIGFVLQTYPADNSTPVLKEAAFCAEVFQYDLPGCQENGSIPINASDFTATNTSLTFGGHVYREGEFALHADGSAKVCSTFKGTFELWPSFVMLKGYLSEIVISTATLSVSMLSLVVVLLTYSLLPQLRNVPGVIVMSYSGCLLASQGLMLLAMLPRGWLCVVYACVTHAMLLSTFLWKSLLSFDLAFMLRIRSIENSSHAKRACMLRWYSVVGWLVPSVFVTCLWLLDYYGVYHVGYGPQGAGACWMGSNLANLFFILGPLVVTWVFNGVCFVLALCMIYRSGRVLGNMAKSKRQRVADRRRLAAYARLTVLMGVTWVMCFAATVWDERPLWLANIFLNASQGVHVLLCFVLKRRVWDMLRVRLSSAVPCRAKPSENSLGSTRFTSSSR
ncbi:hypothetical protein BaRGS_00038033 [Batillaria attramentaria]|uniref:G-protein coupled receptors family 2 profile 2 domain-containing protein n=1 Tax=Batillaria attramentaria TaxID=370345 RepID=A0ABD0J6X6_9CAEN